MSISRRVFSLGAVTAALSACSTGAGPAATPQIGEPRMPSASNPDFDAWLRRYHSTLDSHGIAGRALARAKYLPGVLGHENNQTEFVRSLQDNIALAASDARIAMGRKMLVRHRQIFAGIQARYGVEAHVICAIWGHESNYGARRGNIPTISALATLSYGSRRKRFFEGQLRAALKILQAGDVAAANMTGSWAGAMGHTQFIPTTYQAYAVDYDGDGRRDIWADDPADALASAAAYLSGSGWRKGQPWGVEIRLADGRDMGGRRVPDYGPSEVLTPVGPSGPAFKVFHNYHMLRRYNNAMSYAIGVGHLSDRLAGGRAFQGQFPPDAEGLTLVDRKNLQRRLSAKGFDTGSQDGVIGPKTIAAIQAYQRANNLTVTGKATRALLVALG